MERTDQYLTVVYIEPSQRVCRAYADYTKIIRLVQKYVFVFWCRLNDLTNSKPDSLDLYKKGLGLYYSNNIRFYEIIIMTFWYIHYEIKRIFLALIFGAELWLY